jgi:hypothetical protein
MSLGVASPPLALNCSFSPSSDEVLCRRRVPVLTGVDGFSAGTFSVAAVFERGFGSPEGALTALVLPEIRTAETGVVLLGDFCCMFSSSVFAFAWAAALRRVTTLLSGVISRFTAAGGRLSPPMDDLGALAVFVGGGATIALSRREDVLAAFLLDLSSAEESLLRPTPAIIALPTEAKVRD